MSQKLKRTNVYLDEADWATLKKVAKKNNSTAAQLVRLIVRSYLNRKGKSDAQDPKPA